MFLGFAECKMNCITEAELRRQKILANSEARLKKIRRITLEEVEKESDEQSCKSTPVLQKDFQENESQRENTNVPEIFDDINITKCINESKVLANGDMGNGLLDKSDNEEAVTHLNHKYNYEINSGVNLQSMQNVNRIPNLSQSKGQVRLDSHIFMILGMLIRLLYCVGLSSIFLDNILGPFLVVCLPRVILYINQQHEVSLLYSVILLMGVKESKIKLPFRVISCLRTIIQSLALYLFSFFITHCILKELPL